MSNNNNFNPVFPSVLSTNFFDLENKLIDFSKAGIDFIHLDVMDGNFVTNISFGPSMLKSIKSKFPFMIDAHLMVDNPKEVIPWFIDAGADWISFHIETKDNIAENIKIIKDAGIKAGIALNPDTDIEQIIPFINEVDYILFMSVFPGYGGQKFMPDVLNKIIELNKIIVRTDVSPIIQIDGGVNSDNIAKIREVGVQSYVVGTYLYNSSNISKTINELRGA